MTVECATDGPLFLTFLRRVLCPQLRPGDIAVLDNLAAHRIAGVAETLTEVGATLRYLPPYSPDYNPMELAWSKVKTLLRSRAARTCAKPWVRHCEPSHQRRHALGSVMTVTAYTNLKFALKVGKFTHADAGQRNPYLT